MAKADKCKKETECNFSLSEHTDQAAKMSTSHMDVTSDALPADRIRAVCITDQEYPELLKQIHKPPEVIYCRGRPIREDLYPVAVVGARKATVYGKWGAFETAKYLAERGACIVSGMAYGVDAAAHRGALAGGGYTIAVLAGGLDICYPAAHKGLMAEIIQKGTLVSEFSPGTKCMPYHFPMRNRIISGLSRAVIIPEAGAGSGSLITAEFALEQNRDVYAFPGNISSPYSTGCNRLIQEGAQPVTAIEELGALLGVSAISMQTEEELGEDEREIFALIREGGRVSSEWIMRRTQISCGLVLGILSVLEIKGIIEKTEGLVSVKHTL